MTNPMFDQCARPGCGHSRWSHEMFKGVPGACRAGPEDYSCGCEAFVAVVGPGKMLEEALAIAAEETTLERKLREEVAQAREYEAELLSELEVARGEVEALRVRLRDLADWWDRDLLPYVDVTDTKSRQRCARDLRRALEE